MVGREVPENSFHGLNGVMCDLLFQNDRYLGWKERESCPHHLLDTLFSFDPLHVVSVVVESVEMLP